VWSDRATVRTRRARWTSFAFAVPGARGAAFLIDVGIFWVVWVAGMVLLVETGELGSPPRLTAGRAVAWTLVVIVLWGTYDALSISQWGSTAGRRILDVEVRDAAGGVPSRRTAALRTCVKTVGVVLLGLGIWPIWTEPERRALHDRVAGTVVVRSDELEPAGDAAGGRIGAAVPVDATEAAIRAAAPGPAEAGWLRAVADQTAARLDVAAPSWRRGDDPTATHQRAFCLLLAALLPRYPSHRAVLVAVLDHHAVLDDLGRARLRHLEELVDDHGRARRWLDLPESARIALLLETSARPRRGTAGQAGAR
jgi:uncharacterized RDD family membrane protein YckC